MSQRSAHFQSSSNWIREMDWQRKPKTEPLPRGFTLVEMLVVVAIISILMTAGTIGLSGVEGKGVATGVSNAEALFDEARTTAVARNLRSCVLVAKALQNNPVEDLRRIVVAYEAVNPVTGEPADPENPNPTWVLSSRGMLLPEQTFYSESLSRRDHETGDQAVQTITLSDVKPNFIGDYYIYVFNSEGVCLTPGASFVIGGGARNTSQSSLSAPPRVVARAKRDFGGFVIWRNGGTSLFRRPTQISENLPAVGSPF